MWGSEDPCEKRGHVTHSLHRRGTIEDLHEDFIMLFLLSRIKPQGTYDTMRQIWDVLSRHEHEIVNFGTPTPRRDGGPLHTMEDLRTSADSRMIMAVFKDRETLTNCLKEIKERNFGVSLVISGLYKETGRVCAETGLSPHTVNLSLGIHGNTRRLPEENVLEIHTMCGHAMVSSNLILHLVEEIKKGRATCAEAAKELSRMCDCGIFNTYRAEKILRRMTVL
jgi:hypothetical protein